MYQNNPFEYFKRDQTQTNKYVVNESADGEEDK